MDRREERKKKYVFFEYDSVVALQHVHSSPMNTQYDRSRSRSKTQPKRSHTTHKQTTTKKKKNKTHFFNEFTYSLLIHLINYRATGDARVDETSTSTTKNVARVSINEIVSDNDVRRTQRYNFCICISGVEIG